MSDITHNAGLIGSGASATGGLMAWLDTNASALGLLITFATFILTGIFWYLNYQLNKQRLEFDRRQIEEQKK